MTLQFPYIWGKFHFLFYQCSFLGKQWKFLEKRWTWAPEWWLDVNFKKILSILNKIKFSANPFQSNYPTDLKPRLLIRNTGISLLRLEIWIREIGISKYADNFFKNLPLCFSIYPFVVPALLLVLLESRQSVQFWKLGTLPQHHTGKNSLCEPEKNSIKFNKSLEEKRTKFDFLYTYIK